MAWNLRCFTQCLANDPQVNLDTDMQEGLDEMVRLEQQFERLCAFEQGEAIMIPRADYIDVHIALRAIADNSELPEDEPNVPDEEGEARCPVCREKMGDRPREPPYTMRCNHIIGIDCARLWFAKHNNCPVCRAEQAPPPGARRPSLHNESSETGVALPGHQEMLQQNWEQLEAGTPMSASPYADFPGLPDSIDDRHRWFSEVFIPAVEADYLTRT